MSEMKVRSQASHSMKESFTQFAHEEQEIATDDDDDEEEEEAWYVSYATDHMTPKREWFTTFEDVPEGDWAVTKPDGSHHWVRGRGNIKIQRRLGLHWDHDGVLQHVLYAPGLPKSLFSLAKTVMQGNSVSFGADQCTIRSSEGVEMLTGSARRGGMFRLHIRVMPPELSC